MATIIEQRDYSYSEVSRLLYQLAEQYPFIKIFSLGSSLLGREILAARVGISPRQILYSGAIHGSERLTAGALLLFLEEFSAALAAQQDYSIASARNALFGKSLVVVPISNPDGYEIARAGAATAGERADAVREINGSNDIKYWNANARGIDLNHNFDAGFDEIKRIEQADGITAPAPRRYGGSYPESEPEVLAFTQYARQNDIALLMSLHSQGEEIYWEYGSNTPPKSLRLARLFSTASGYTVASPAPGASHAGMKDWFVDEFGRPAFTLEIGRGVNPLPPSELYAIYARLRELFLLSVALA